MKNNKKSITTQLLSNRKHLLFIVLFLTILVDGFVTFDLLFNAKVALQYALIPLIMCVIDIVYFISSFFTNYRFKYSLSGIVIYVGAIASCSLACLGTYAWNLSNVVMTTVSWGLFLFIHLAVIIGLIYGIVLAKTYFKKKITMPLVGGSLLSIIFSVIFLSLVSSNGFYGQIYIEEGRVVSYQYDEKTDGYIVSSLLEGRGNTIVVPDKFNNKEVVGVNLEVLKDSQIRAVRFEKGTENIAFVNSQNFSGSMNHLKNIKLLADKEEITPIRKSLLNAVSSNNIASSINNNIVELSNNFYPNNLDNNEVYVSFSYDLDSFNHSKGEILQPLVIEKGSKISPYQLNYINYAKYSDLSNEEHLGWSYNFNNKKIMNPLVDSSKNSILGNPINNDLLNVEVSFEDVYAISIDLDNDDLYEIDDSYKTTSILNGKYGFRYTLKENAQSILDSIPQREGFTLTWSCMNKEVTNLSSYLVGMSNEKKVTLIPEWTLNAPKISNVYTNDIDNNFTYGDTVILDCEHDEITSGIKYKYEWVKSNSTYKYQNKQTTLSNVHPSLSGTYQIKVTAYSDTITSLTSLSTESINVNIEKKDLDFIWTTPSDLVYNGQNKIVTCDFNENQVINEDNITFEIMNNSRINAGNYLANVSLTGDASEKYKIPSQTSSCAFEITKRPVTVSWNSNRSFVYDGLPHNVTVNSISNFVNNEEQEIIESLTYSQAINAGNYKQIVYLTHQNYYFENEQTCDFDVLKRDITITFSPYTKTYDGQITSTSEYKYTTSNIATTDTLEQILTLQYQGDAVTSKDVGTYEFDPTYIGGKLINNYNVNIVDTNGILTINKRSISLNWDKNSFVYNAEEQRPSVNKITDPVLEEEKSIIDSLIYTEGKVNVGTNYIVQADLSSNMSKNYTLVQSSKTYTYKITQKDLVINVNDVTKTYDKQAYNDFTYEVIGIVGQDLEEEIFTNSFIGTAVGATNVGSYTISLSLSQQQKYGNYKITNNSGTLNINKRNVELIWDSNNTYVYDGFEKTLNVIGVEGAVEGDEGYLLSYISYENGNIHVGTHTQVCNLTSTYANNYNIANNTNKHTYSITPKDATIIINDTLKVYDGTASTGFTHIVNGLVSTDTESDIFSYSYNGSGTTSIDVGDDYEIGIVLSSKSVTSNGKTYQRVNDYNFIIEKGKAKITPREISFVWDSNISYVYNGYTQGVTVTSVNNVVAKDKDSVLRSITYNLGNTNVGNYTREASLNNKNYQVVEVSRFKDYSITPKTLTINIQPATKTYDGTNTNNFSFSTSGIVYTDKQQEIFSLTYTGTAVTAINVGTYEINAVTNEGTKYNNYVINVVPSTLTISPRVASVVWSSNRTMEYNGTVQGVEVTNFNSIVPEDKETLLASLTYNLGNINVGNYVREVTSSNSNYTLSNITCSYTISSRQLIVKIDNVTKVYDGNTFSAFSHTTTNLAPGDNESEVLSISYVGPATTSVNVGEYLISASYSLKTDGKGKNYSISITGGYLTITPREISLIWDLNNSFLYNGESLGIEVVSATGIVGSVSDFISKITYNSKQSQVGTHTRIAYINNNNYVIKDGSNMMEYYITSTPLS